MYEVKISDRVKSLSIFVGMGICNATCSHCAGMPLRKYSPIKDGEIDLDLIKKLVISCHNKGARNLTISGSGEPTLSPVSLTKLMNLLFYLSEIGYKFQSINLYSNGIRIGQDLPFCEKYLTLWKSRGLSTVYVTVHHTNEKENAKIFNVPSYPPLKEVFSRIHQTELNSRANLILGRLNISTFSRFKEVVEFLFQLGVSNISAWPIRDHHSDVVDTSLIPDHNELNKMVDYSNEQNKQGKRIRILLEDSKLRYKLGEKLTLFPNGKISNTWCV